VNFCPNNTVVLFVNLRGWYTRVVREVVPPYPPDDREVPKKPRVTVVFGLHGNPWFLCNQGCIGYENTVL